MPVAGAPHSDDFKITTLPNLSGWKPYMLLPTGRNGKLDVLNRKLDQGQWTIQVQDQRLTAGGSNLQRWLTAALGSLSGTAQVLGVLGLMEESLDGGSSWSNHSTGRLDSVQLNGSRIITGLVFKDLSSELNTKVFVGRAAAGVSYVIEPTLLPLGLSGAYGPTPAAVPLHATFGSDGVFRTLTVTAGDLSRADNLITAAILAAVRTGVNVRQSVKPGIRVRFTTAGVTDKEAELVYVSTIIGRSLGQFISSPLAVSKLWLKPTDSTSDPYYQDIATGVIANTTACTFTLRQRFLQLDADEGESGSAVILNDVHPVQLWSDLLDGKFSRLKTDGTIPRTFPKNAAAFATLIADNSFPLCRFVITEPAKMQDWIEKNILHPFGLGCYLNESGEVVPVDLRPPQSSPTSTTITNADLDSDQAPQWSIDRDSAISVLQVRTYRDTPLDARNIGSTGAIPNPIPGLVESHAVDYLIPNFSEATLGVADFGERTHLVEVQGLRACQDEQVAGHDREEWIKSRGAEVASFFRPLFGSGAQYLTLACRRTSNTNGVNPGTWRLIDVDEVPGLSSYVRGENRLMLCVESTPKGLTRTLRFLDAGPNTVASQPSVGTPAQEGSNTQNGITVAVTLNASSEEAVLDINVTATSVGSRPADSDAGWRRAVVVGQIRPWLSSSATYTVRNLPAGKRVWVRVRTDPVIGKKLSSAWAYPGGTGYVDTATITAPSALASSSVSTKSAILTWTVGDATKKTVVRRFGAATQVVADAGTPVDFLELPPGTSKIQIDGLDTGGAWWHFDVYHKDEFGGTSSVNNLAAFQATGTAPTAPTPGGLVILVSDANSPVAPPIDGIKPYGKPGIRLGAIPNPLGIGLDFAIYRAPDSGGSPGSYALLRTIPGDQMSGVLKPIDDYTAQDNLIYWYKGRHEGAGVDPSAYTADVSAKPGWLRPEVSTVPGEPVLGTELPPIYIMADDLVPTLNTTSYFCSGGEVRPNTLATAANLRAGVRLPAGAQIVLFEALGKRNNAGDSCVVELDELDDGPGVTTVKQFVFAAAAGYQPMSDSTPYTIRSDRRYRLRVDMTSNAALTDSGFQWLRLTITPNSYTQMR